MRLIPRSKPGGSGQVRAALACQSPGRVSTMRRGLVVPVIAAFAISCARPAARTQQLLTAMLSAVGGSKPLELTLQRVVQLPQIGYPLPGLSELLFQDAHQLRLALLTAPLGDVEELRHLSKMQPKRTGPPDQLQTLQPAGVIEAVAAIGAPRGLHQPHLFIEP